MNQAAPISFNTKNSTSDHSQNIFQVTPWQKILAEKITVPYTSGVLNRFLRI